METKFNFKSQVCTYRFQSERLLVLGLKKETADCYWFYCDIAKEWKCTILSSTQVFKDYPTTVIPAWSLHRLMEMAFNSLNDADADAEDEIYFIRQKNPFESMLELFEWLIKEGYFNKEYLV